MEGAAMPDGHVLGKKMNLDGIFFDNESRWDWLVLPPGVGGTKAHDLAQPFDRRAPS
jgi:hypothetical protein